MFHIGEVVRKLRKERQWTLEGLSSRSGVDVMVLSKLENTGAGFKIRTLERVATAFDCDVAALYVMLASFGEGQLQTPNAPSPLVPAGEAPTSQGAASGTAATEKKDAVTLAVPRYLLPLWNLVREVSPESVSRVATIMMAVVAVCSTSPTSAPSDGTDSPASRQDPPGGVERRKPKSGPWPGVNRRVAGRGNGRSVAP